MDRQFKAAQAATLPNALNGPVIHFDFLGDLCVRQAVIGFQQDLCPLPLAQCGLPTHQGFESRAFLHGQVDDVSLLHVSMEHVDGSMESENRASRRRRGWALASKCAQWGQALSSDPNPAVQWIRSTSSPWQALPR
jgi:hypothetical protein